MSRVEFQEKIYRSARDAYRRAGVDVEAGYAAVKKIEAHAQRTRVPGVMAGIGGFGGLFALPPGLQEPVLVAGTDGVGTKLRLAMEVEDHTSIGIDLVAMCVNDVLVQGARPLFFLDYLATSRVDPDRVEEVVRGIADGCVEAGCALLGGETAEMPGFYHGQDYDLAGFCVGVVEKAELVTGAAVAPGDMLIGLASSGLHSNGFSLVRNILREAGAAGEAKLTECLTPTAIYVKPILHLLENVCIKAMAHITGGGLVENVPRMLPQGCAAVLEGGTWPVPPIFTWLQKTAALRQEAMLSTFNMGLGMVLCVAPNAVGQTMAVLDKVGVQAFTVGHVTTGRGFIWKESKQ